MSLSYYILSDLYTNEKLAQLSSIIHVKPKLPLILDVYPEHTLSFFLCKTAPRLCALIWECLQHQARVTQEGRRGFQAKYRQ